MNEVYSQQPIPDWTKNIFAWHDYGLISNIEFVNSIKYLIDNEIIFVSKSEQERINLLIDETAGILINIIHFRSPLSMAPNEIINFAVVGDVATKVKSLRTLESIALTDPEAILFAGDLSYGPAEDWFDISDFLGLDRTFTAIGNHELGELAKYMEYYGMENEFYSFDYENVHLVALSMYTDYSQESEQYEFLENDLKSASTDPRIDWIIIFFHEPMYTDTRYANVDFRNILQPLFDLYDVDIVVQGHAHIYERTKPLKFNNTITDDSTSSYIDPDGQIYVTVGTGGKGLKSKTGTGFIPNQQSEWSTTQNDEDFGFLNIKLPNDGKRLVGEFITNEGRILDNFEICLHDIKSVCTEHNDLAFSQTNLSRIVSVGKDLRYVNLFNVDLSGMNLTNVNLSYANLSYIDLTGADLSFTNLTRANLKGAALSGADLSFTDLTRAILTGADLSFTDLTGANLKGVIFRGADFSNAVTITTSMNKVNLVNANLTGANLQGAELNNADLRGVDLSYAKLLGAHLNGANLSGANLNGANLNLAELYGANLGCVNHPICN